MTWDFSSFSTEFRSYQYDGQMIMVCNGNPFGTEKIFTPGGLKLGAATSVGQR